MSTDRLTIGIDIGGTSVRAGVVDPFGRVLEAVRVPTPTTVEETEAVFVRLITELAGRHPVHAVGLAVAGFISRDRATVMYAPHLAWRDAPVPARIGAAVGLPVRMDHDVNAATLAEYRLGAAAGSTSVLLIALGTGIGAGLMLDGTIYRGAYGVAPELGHLQVVPDGRPCPCGKTGCLERYCSGTALAVTARELTATEDWPVLAELCGGRVQAITGSMVGSAARQGDPAAVAAVAELARWLGHGMALAADVLDPEMIVIGGGVSGISDLFLPAAVAEADRRRTGAAHRPAPVVVASHFTDSAGLVGASLLARAGQD